MPSIWKNFDHMFEVFQGLFFAFLLQRKDALGTRLQPNANKKDSAEEIFFHRAEWLLPNPSTTSNKNEERKAFRKTKLPIKRVPLIEKNKQTNGTASTDSNIFH